MIMVLPRNVQDFETFCFLSSCFLHPFKFNLSLNFTDSTVPAGCKPCDRKALPHVVCTTASTHSCRHSRARCCRTWGACGRDYWLPDSIGESVCLMEWEAIWPLHCTLFILVVGAVWASVALLHNISLKFSCLSSSDLISLAQLFGHFCSTFDKKK